ncbi:MAG TPA: hypothetical protein VL549_15020, partial [Gemmatimonadales bacterium]|nr:hypothetical protein [Gemmatimonadales bacterium]
NAYTLTGLQTIGPTEATQSPLKINLIPPVSTMLQTSFTQTATAQPGTQNGNVEFPQELSVFFGEAISPRIGTFIQITYDGADGSLAMDNVSLRYAKHGRFASKPVLWGVTVNNNPTVQDVWNSTPVWGYPFASSGVAPTPAAAPLIDGGLSQNVAGMGTYALWNDHVYGELSVYRSAPQGGAHPPDATSEFITKGVAPYWRLAYQRTFGTQYLEVGTYGLSAQLYPAGVSGPTDRFTDIGGDLQFERHAGKGGQGTFVVHASFMHEQQKLDATFGAGGSANAKNNLNTFRADAALLTPSRWGGTLGFFTTSGTADTLLYTAAPVTGNIAGKPNSSGVTAEIQYMPWINTRFSLQYVAYQKFNGASSNYDGSGRSASDNNTIYLLAWLMF